MKILALDLGKNKSVACTYDVGIGKARFETLSTCPTAVDELLLQIAPDRVVIEVSSAAGWVADLVEGSGTEQQVANTAAPAWRWSNTKRKSFGAGDSSRRVYGLGSALASTSRIFRRDETSGRSPECSSRHVSHVVSSRIGPP